MEGMKILTTSARPMPEITVCYQGVCFLAQLDESSLRRLNAAGYTLRRNEHFGGVELLIA